MILPRPASTRRRLASDELNVFQKGSVQGKTVYQLILTTSQSSKKTNAYTLGDALRLLMNEDPGDGSWTDNGSPDELPSSLEGSEDPEGHLEQVVEVQKASDRR